MKVSVVTVAYNSAATIADTLRSVAAQTHPDIEHVVIDGASSDDTLRIVTSMSCRVTRLVSEPDRGIYDAMNKGLALASGDVVGFLNADDVFCDSGSVAAIVEAFRHSAADAVYGDLVYVREHDPSSVVRVWRSGHFSRKRLRFGWMPPHPTFYVRREIMHALGGFDTSYRIAADYDFLLRCLSHGDLAVAYIPRVLVRMRAGGASNRSLSALWHKSREDLRALRGSGVGGIGTLLCKNVRKLPQFFERAPDAGAQTDRTA